MNRTIYVAWPDVWERAAVIARRRRISMSRYIMEALTAYNREHTP